MTRVRHGLERDTCRCGSQVEYAQCCGPFHTGEEIPQSAEQLMRSRYCAFVLCDEAYLLATWHAATRPGRVRLDRETHWLKLGIRATHEGGIDDLTGIVEFEARFKVNGKAHRLREISRFEKIEGRWYYLDGKHL